MSAKIEGEIGWSYYNSHTDDWSPLEKGCRLDVKSGNSMEIGSPNGFSHPVKAGAWNTRIEFPLNMIPDGIEIEGDVVLEVIDKPLVFSRTQMTAQVAVFTLNSPDSSFRIVRSGIKLLEITQLADHPLAHTLKLSRVGRMPLPKDRSRFNRN